MTKEELRKEFDELDRYSSNITQILDNKFDWFYSKLEEKEKETLSVLEQGINHKRKWLDLEKKLKAADEVIYQYSRYSNTISYQLNKALEHYKSL